MASLWFSVEYCWCSVDILTYCAARIRGRPVSSPSWPRLPLSAHYPVLPHLGRGPAVVRSPRMSAEDGRRRSYGLSVISYKGRREEVGEGSGRDRACESISIPGVAVYYK